MLDDSGNVTLIAADAADAADAVVLATGGFQGNPELLSRYAGLDANDIAHRSNPWSTGDGLATALAAGATTTGGLSGFYGHALPAPPARHTAETFAELSQYYGCKSVAVNMAGHRFVDETAGAFEENVNEALARQPRGLGFYVFDDAIGQEATSTATTWFTGTAAEFIESSRRAFENGFDVVHTSSGSAVTVSGERAIAQTRMTISQRAALNDVDVDATCHGRFFDFFVNSGDSGRRNRQEWSLVRRQPIYDRDRVDPVKPGAVPQLDFTAMSKFPHGYQHPFSYLTAYLSAQLADRVVFIVRTALARRQWVGSVRTPI